MFKCLYFKGNNSDSIQNCIGSCLMYPTFSHGIQKILFMLCQFTILLDLMVHVYCTFPLELGPNFLTLMTWQYCIANQAIYQILNFISISYIKIKHSFFVAVVCKHKWDFRTKEEQKMILLICSREGSGSKNMMNLTMWFEVFNKQHVR